MDTTVASTLLPALLEKSLTVTILAVLLAAALWAIYKLWQRGISQDTAHAAALAALNTLRMQETQEYALGRKESSDHLRTMVDKFNQVLTSIEQRGVVDEKTRILVVAIAAELKIPLQNFV